MNPVSDTPIPDKAVTVDSLIAEHARRLQAVYNTRTAGDHTFTGVLAAFATAVSPHLADRQDTTDDRPVCPCVDNDTHVHAGDQPAPTELAHLHEDSERMRQRLFELGPLIDALAYGGVADELVRLRRQSAGRDTETADLKATIGRLFDGDDEGSDEDPRGEQG